ncbi:phospholipase D family protein [Thermomonas sp.]|uniref:phospholipase D family protein n=1 Tax=Thermomonas sp. TaxID=1971895 RepID=UPI001B6EE152|nr:phospholipase D family protein [Thermomonas sp.]MBK6332657.1 phospholipase D family protein [Thermomonas sp.]MBK6416357.1 phospholipase D family protein [Thermomonas sp.]MBK6925095.1 phospholipase D family protein [Thermomonas sp.]MBK7205633.1 phospholipase D family protein [Thermomonas sp.]MBK9668842.1 phospholipase D family protein [Thermomonas sp.]
MPALLRSLLLGALLLLAGCAQLPARPQLPYQAALPVAEGTRLDAEVAPAVARHPGASGFRLVADGMEAFALRGHSARSAGRSLDIQTYIWHDDLTGRLLAAEVLDAADRGVQVRVLLDDLDARAKSQALLALDSHPRISIRIFNPLATRDGMLGTALEFASDFERVNRRAHNKSWIVDGRLAVAGGRNLGDEYFMASPEANFQDLDLLVAGPAVAALADAFDSYWNSESAWPIRALEPRKPQGEALQAVRESLRQSTSDAGKEAWVQALGEPDALARIRVGHLGMRWTQQWQLLQDAPDKLVQQVQPIAGTDASPILAGLRSAMQSSQREIAIISPYFVPGEEGANSLVAGVRGGLRIRILTNSLASNDVAAVHGGYVRHRGVLARGGVELWEMKPRPGRAQGSLLGSSGARLHGKAAIFDRRTLFVGSLNLDPRSVQLNSEQGLLVTDEVLAAQLSAMFDNMTRPENAWSIGWDPARGRVSWSDGNGTLDREPEAGLSRRVVARLAYWLPVDPLL